MHTSKPRRQYQTQKIIVERPFVCMPVARYHEVVFVVIIIFVFFFIIALICFVLRCVVGFVHSVYSKARSHAIGYDGDI
jgi:hypothetical protein